MHICIIFVVVKLTRSKAQYPDAKWWMDPPVHVTRWKSSVEIQGVGLSTLFPGNR